MPKKKSVKKKPVKKVSKKEVCDTNSKCHCNIGCIKLSSMAFILFLVTVWPKVGAGLLKLHWGWYLGIFVVLGLGAMGTHKHCMCCKK
jgi:hypothetical protein